MFTFLSFYSAPLIPNSMSLQNMQIGNLSRGECNAGLTQKAKMISWKKMYFIHTEIYIAKHYRSCLWLDERCIFSVVRFQSLKCDGLHRKKFKYVWTKTSYRYDALTNLPVRSARSFVFFFFFFFFFHLNSWTKIVRAHLAWDNLSLYVFLIHA